MNRIIRIVIIALLSLLWTEKSGAAGGADISSAAGGMDADSLRVSLVTCWPGPEIYELCGHEAIRVQGAGFDDIWNYGTFDFNEPNFVGRFVSGQTDYKVVSYPFVWFLEEYRRRGSRVVEQELLLPAPEKRRLLEMLRRNALPENCTYRYNYVRDNCATRIVAMVDSASSRRIIYPDSVSYGTFREGMRHYHGDYPWYQFGIDLVLGVGLDRPVTRREEMFLPLEMMESYSGARFAGGGAVVAPSEVLYSGKEDATLGPTPWYLTPLAVSVVMMGVTLWCVWYWWKRRKVARWWYTIYFGVCGLAGLLVTYLVFFSTHEATSPNLLLLWLNPLQLIVAFGVWWRTWRWPTLAVSVADAVALTVLLIAWPTQAQSTAAAVFLMMGCGVILGILYAIIFATKSYYNNGGIPAAGTAGRGKPLSGRGSGGVRKGGVPRERREIERR